MQLTYVTLVAMLPDFKTVSEYATKTLGFHQVAGLALPLNDFSKEGENLKAWLQEGYQADMQWMVNHLERRLKPEDLMAGAQMVLCVTLNYNPGPINEHQAVKIARYAQGDDYHKVIKNKLKQLLKWLQSYEAELIGRAVTDSAPVLEKALAVKAGLGWQGKHSCLITKDIGSWVFIGELFLSHLIPQLPEPAVLPDYCGRCRRCIEACPTDAILPHSVVDANKCISYWTIESKVEQFPAEITENLNGWLFGCDICQDVCPWNLKFEQTTLESAFKPRAWNENPQLESILALDEITFKSQYQGSPIKRTKLTGLQRNAKALLK